MIQSVNVDTVDELLHDMKKTIARNFITKNTVIEQGKYKVYKIYIFWVFPVYKSVTIFKS